MTIVRAAVIAAAVCAVVVTASASETERTVPGPSLWELNNRTVTSPAGIRPLAGGTQIISFCGVDLVGGDIWQARHPNPDSCVANCRADTGCDAATWTPYQGGTCFFKRLNGAWANSVPSVGAASFVRVPVNVGVLPAPRFPANVDMPGNDLDFRQVDSPLECTLVCKLNPFCFAFTWTAGSASGNCYLKRKASPYVYTPGCTSEYSGRVTNPDTCLV